MRELLAELIILINPTMYQKYVVHGNNGKTILYVNVQKDFYVYIRAALLFYEYIYKDLEVMGFFINPFEPSLVNKIFSGK